MFPLYVRAMAISLGVDIRARGATPKYAACQQNVQFVALPSFYRRTWRDPIIIYSLCRIGLRSTGDERRKGGACNARAVWYLSLLSQMHSPAAIQMQRGRFSTFIRPRNVHSH